jgi:energy-coupling factor transporter transmembrane protein EcfT
VALAVRTLLIGVCAAAFLAVVDPARLLTSLHVVARLPARVTCALLAAHRLLDDLPEEWTAIRRAHAVRRPADADGRREPGRDVRSLARAAFVLLATTIRRAERIAVALESRGLGAVPRAQRTVWTATADHPGVLAGPAGALRPSGRPGRADVVLVSVAVGAVGLVLAAAGGPGQTLWTAITTAT